MIGLAAWIQHLQAGGQIPHPPAGGRPPFDFTKEQIEAALVWSNGLVTLAARRLKCSRRTFYTYLDKYPEINPRSIRADIREEVKDVAEGHLFNAVRKGDMKQVRYFLDRQAKDRGYTIRKEMTGENGGALEVKGNLALESKPDLDLTKLTDEQLIEWQRLLVAAGGRMPDGTLPPEPRVVPG